MDTVLPIVLFCASAAPMKGESADLWLRMSRSDTIRGRWADAAMGTDPARGSQADLGGFGFRFSHGGRDSGSGRTAGPLP